MGAKGVQRAPNAWLRRKNVRQKLLTVCEWRTAYLSKQQNLDKLEATATCSAGSKVSFAEDSVTAEELPAEQWKPVNGRVEVNFGMYNLAAPLLI